MDFDKLVRRMGTDSIKWEYVSKGGCMLRSRAGENPLAANSFRTLVEHIG